MKKNRKIFRLCGELQKYCRAGKLGGDVAVSSRRNRGRRWSDRAFRAVDAELPCNSENRKKRFAG